MNYFKKSAVTLWILSLAAVAQAETVVKFATLAPEGSTWMNAMQAWNEELVKVSTGQIKFRFYPGGISGDERDVVRKIRFGQLHAAGFTGVGLGEIAPEVRVLDGPFLFRNTDEVDHIYKTFDREFREEFQNKGYVLLGWAEVGFVYFFSAAPAQNLENLRGIKMWMWEGDPIAEASFKVMDMNPVPLSIVDVMTSLQTGLINGVYSSPLAMLALQWFTKTKHMSSFQLANASGAVLLSKSFFDKLPKEQQELLLKTGQKHLSKLTALSREENKAAIQTLKRNGVTVTAVTSAQEVAQYEGLGAEARKMLVGKLYSQDLLSKVEKSISEFRSKPKK